MLVENGNHLMLFDTGGFWGKELLGSVEKLGFLPDDITHVLNTHFHGDHAGGNALFPKAVKIASEREYVFSREWLSDFSDAKNREDYMREHFPYLDTEVIRDRARLLSEHLEHIPDYWWNGEMDGYSWIENGADIPPSISAIETPGHTPHHVSYVVSGERGRIIFSGDALSQRSLATGDSALDEPHLDLASHKKSKDMILSMGGVIVPGHDRPFTAGNSGAKVGKKIEF
jgi:glyoxylase-like metal-dependent hydrolase (beta-lactamase superfamily II)